jgi:NAD(P)H dehydrogenase (quinone)
MRVLVIFCHPCEDSFNAAIYRTAQAALTVAGHEMRCHDLYREGFQPVMTPEERANYITTTEPLLSRTAQHAEDLRWCEALIVIYPTWYYGAPAMLKGWLECVFLPGITFAVSQETGKLAKLLLTNVRRFVGITTSGSPWWWIKLIGDPGRKLWTRGLFMRAVTGTRTSWYQLYDMNHTTEASRAAFLARIDRQLRKL